MSILLIFTLGMVPLVVHGNSTSWPTHGGGTNSHFSPITIQGNLFVEHNTIVAGNMPRAIEGDTLYATHLSQPGQFYAIDLKSNTIQWEFVTDDSKEIIRVVTAGDMVYISTVNKIYALENRGHQYTVRWMIASSTNEEFGELAVDGDKVFYGSYDDFTRYPLKNNRIIAVDYMTGENKWSYSLGDHTPVPNRLTVGNGKIFFFINNQMTMTTNLYAIDQKTSFVQWVAPIHPNLSPSSGYPVYENGMVFLDVSPSGGKNSVRAFNAETGRLVWEYQLENRFSFSNNIGVVSVSNSSVNFLDNRGNLISLNIYTGRENWKTLYADAINSTQIAISRTPVLLTNNLVILENSQKIKIYDIHTGEKLQELPYGNRGYMPMMIVGNRLIIADKAGIQTLNFIGQQENPKDVIPEDPKVYDTYYVQRGDTLSKIAARFHTTADYLAMVNKIADPNMIYIGQPLKVPSTPVQPVSPSPSVPTPATIEYVVKAGDTLAKIAASQQVTVEAIVSLNGITNPNMIYVGQVLMIPTKSGEPISPAPSVPVPTTIEYVVKAGDTLSKIAAAHQVSLQEIADLNGITNQNMIYVGQKILIPSKETIQTKTHTVVAGESIWTISQLYGVTMDSIIKNNNIANANQLYVGQQLIIK